jgi:DNA-binding response OmpR family regulator
VSGRVLLVDDDELVRRTLTTVVRRAGFAVTAAEEAVPAMELMDQFDIVVVDFRMRTGTGDDVVRHFKARFGSQVFCVVLSGEDDERTLARCRDAGADMIMHKPVLPSALRQCLTDGLMTLRAAA